MGFKLVDVQVVVSSSSCRPRRHIFKHHDSESIGREVDYPVAAIEQLVTLFRRLAPRATAPTTHLFGLFGDWFLVNRVVEHVVLVVVVEHDVVPGNSRHTETMRATMSTELP